MLGKDEEEGEEGGVGEQAVWRCWDELRRGLIWSRLGTNEREGDQGVGGVGTGTDRKCKRRRELAERKAHQLMKLLAHVGWEN